jgi:hypothetical protein
MKCRYTDHGFANVSRTKPNDPDPGMKTLAATELPGWALAHARNAEIQATRTRLRALRPNEGKAVTVTPLAQRWVWTEIAKLTEDTVDDTVTAIVRERTRTRATFDSVGGSVGVPEVAFLVTVAHRIAAEGSVVALGRAPTVMGVVIALTLVALFIPVDDRVATSTRAITGVVARR